MGDDALRMGIVGTNFVSDWFVEACRRSGAAEPVAVCSREEQTGADFASRHGLTEVHTSLESMLDSDQVEAVYLASPIAAHYQQAMQSLIAGRHVLCEKTIGADAGQTRQIFLTARSRGVVAMEAVRSLYDPAFDVVREHLAALGEVRMARFDKQQYSSRYDRFKAGEQINAFDPALDNAAVADIGVYCLEPALDLFGPPESVTASGVQLANGFEAAGTMVLGYPDSVVTCSWSKVSRSVTPSTIHGELATMTIDNISGPGRITIERPDAEPEVILERPDQRDADNMPEEVSRFVELVRAGQGDTRREEISFLTRELIDNYLQSFQPDFTAP